MALARMDGGGGTSKNTPSKQRIAAQLADRKKIVAAVKNPVVKNPVVLRPKQQTDREKFPWLYEDPEPRYTAPEDTETYKALREADYLDWQKQRADELLRLRNLETELFAPGGTVAQQETGDLEERRRLAAQMAASGTLQGGAYAGGQRGLDTLARVQQTNEMQNLLRPYNEQVSTNRLGEYGISYDPRAAALRQASEGAVNARDTYGGTFSQQDNFATTYAGRTAAQRARANALAELRSGMVNL